MKIYRVIMCTLATADGWQSATHLPTFYVHGVDCEAAKCQALRVAGAPKYSSGSLVAVDANLDPIEVFYLAWSK